MKCPVCKQNDEVQRSRRGPIGMAFDDVNPLEPYRCYRCWRLFWRPKVARRFVFSSLLGLLVVLFVVNAGVQAATWMQGKGYRTADRTKLFVNLDPSIRCDNCGSSDISRSTLRPLDRIVSWINPLTPYRCWGCWNRFWLFKPPLEAATNLALFALLILVVVRAFRNSRKRMDDAIAHAAMQV